MMENIGKILKENLLNRKSVIIISAIFILFPIFTKDYYLLSILIFANIYAIFGASWDLLAGFTGIFSFGQVLFFGVAAYMSGYLNLFLHLPPIVTIPIGGAFGVLVGLVAGLPSLRLKGPYFSIITLTFPGILAGFIYMYPEISGGEAGIYGLSSISSDIVVTYYSSLFLMLGSILILLGIVGSRLGLIFRSIRDDQDSAEATGINTTKYKLIAFAISGFFAGIAGGFQAHLLMSISPFVFNVSYSFQAMLGASLGGMGTIFGSLGGSYLMSFLNESLRGLAEFRILVSAIVMILVFRYIPEGLIRRITRRYNFKFGTWSELKKLKRKRNDAKNP
jgi:branched-chain amino acid transport system permease protein